MKTFVVLLFMLIGAPASAQRIDTVFLKNMLQSHPELFSGILHHSTQNEVQILYTQIDRDKHNKPHFRSYSYRLNPQRYFFPASTVKLPTAIFALEKLNELHLGNLDMHTAMFTDSSFTGETKVTADTSSTDGKPSVENYIKKILLVSDNDAYNRLYEFIGRAEINRKLKKYGLNHTRIVARLALYDGGESARHTNSIIFKAWDRTITLQDQYDGKDYPMHLDNMRQGKGYLDKNDKLIMEPYDFREKNVYSIADQQMVLKRLLFPETFPKKQRFNLTKEQYQLIYRYMSMYPTESKKPTYNPPAYYPAFCKYLFYGQDSLAKMDPNIRIFNKIGDSYGYDVDNIYLVDFKNKVEFMLTAVVQSNEDGIYNDNKYEYTTVCQPFLRNLGQTVYQYELNRHKKHLPNLSKFKFAY